MDELTDEQGAPDVPNEDEELSDDVGEESDELASLPPDRLVQMLREKRRAEQAVRQKLREVQASNSALEGAVSGFRAQQVRAEALKAGVLDSALDDVVASVPLEGLITEDGTVDSALLSTAIEELRKRKPFYWPTHQIPRALPHINHTGATYGGTGSTWGDVING